MRQEYTILFDGYDWDCELFADHTKARERLAKLIWYYRNDGWSVTCECRGIDYELECPVRGTYSLFLRTRCVED